MVGGRFCLTVSNWLYFAVLTVRCRASAPAVVGGRVGGRAGGVSERGSSMGKRFRRGDLLYLYIYQVYAYMSDVLGARRGILMRSMP